jgi:hypothetical protein
MYVISPRASGARSHLRQHAHHVLADLIGCTDDEVTALVLNGGVG